MALVCFMVTYRNPDGRHPSTPRNRIYLSGERHVTGADGNVWEPLFINAEKMSPPASQSVRPTFDIVKAKTLLERSGKSYAAIARALGFERQAVGHWFRGRGEPSVQQMKVMAAEMGCHWLELVTDDTLIVYREDERQRLARMRQLDDGALAELDAFLAFKAAQHEVSDD